MGDMADFVLDQIDYYYYNERSRTKQCKYCLQKGLKWVQTDKGFRLFDKNNKIHICEKYEQK